MLPLFQFIDHVRLRSCRLVFFAALVAYSSISQAVFNTPGQFAVSPSGAAAYDIPIQVPPGTAGMIPKLSLSYNSQSGNGSLGYGWALVGFSQVSLCPRTIAQDRVKGGIHFDNKDRFCLDGQRLVLSSGDYGADQSEYRTEIASFSKIIAYGAAGNAPASFKVWTKSGLMLEFGTTADSRIEAQGKATPRIWGISRITDTLGNYLTVSYDENNANGEAYVSRVDYTGNIKASPELMPYASVRFVYEDRPDVTTDTIAGSVLKISKRVKNIRTYVGDALVKDYVFTYSNNGAYHLSSSNQADGSLLTKIQECDGSATPACLNPTSFGWQPGTNNKAIFGTLSDFAPTNLVQVGDFTGDGMADAIGFSRSGKIFTVSTTRGDFYYTASNGSGFASSVPLLSLYGIGGTRQYQYMNGGKPALGLMKDVFWPKLLMADINRDGMDDLINASSYCVRLSKGNSFAADCNVWGSGPIAAAGDINGDGYADIVYDTATPSGPGQLVIAFSGPSGITSTVNTGIVGGSYRCILSNASGCQGWFYMSPEAFLADFDGDGNADLLINNKIMLSNGNGFAAAQDWGLIPGSHVFSVADINGDGRVDVMYDTTTRSAIGKIFVAFSTGTGFAGAYDTGVTTMGFICLSADGVDECPAANFVYSPPYAAIGDMNGDGRADLLVSNGSYSALYNVSDPDLITTFAQTLGGTTTVSYSRYVYSGLYVATNVSETDGIGGARKSAYSYAGPQINKFGRGFKGFGTVSIYDLDAGVITAMTYLQFFPFIGMASSSIKQTTSGQLLVSTKSEYAHETLTEGAATTYFPYLTKNIDTARDLDGGYITSTQTDYQYDAFGNVKKVVVTSSDGHVKTTVNEYVNDTGKWILGRLVRSVVTSQTP